jgi:carbonic anhydrase
MPGSRGARWIQRRGRSATGASLQSKPSLTGSTKTDAVPIAFAVRLRPRRSPDITMKHLTHFLNRLASVLASGALVTLAAQADEPVPHWGYTGTTGPSHWASEDPTFATCGNGHRQSPINIRNAAQADLPAIQFTYKAIPLTVTDTGHSMQVNVPPYLASIQVGVDRYDLVQLHFHRPSEERINGRRSSMVMHLVHKDARGDLAVVAVLIREGDSNPALKQIFDNMPANGQSAVTPGTTLDLAQLLPTGRGYYTFEGSLTTPPCTEGVRWFVLKNPIQASPGQVMQFASHYPSNARPTQPLNGRKIQRAN